MNHACSGSNARSSSVARNVSSRRPHPRSRSKTSPSQYVTESRSGDTCSPCIVMSSPVFAITVTASGATARTSPRRNFPAPIPPASAVTRIHGSVVRSRTDGRGHDRARAPARARPRRCRQGAVGRRDRVAARGARSGPPTADVARVAPARARTRQHRHVLAQGLRPAHDAVPGPLPLLHVRQAARQARTAVPVARRRSWRSPRPGRRLGCKEALFTLGDRPGGALPGGARRGSPNAGTARRSSTSGPPRSA